MSKADALLKLVELKEKGLISDIEFNNQKESILNQEASSELLQQFKNFMSQHYSDYSLITSSENSLNYQKHIPASNPGCITTLILLLIGILPGIIYFLLARKEAQVKTLSATLEDSTLIIAGYKADLIDRHFKEILV